MISIWLKRLVCSGFIVLGLSSMALASGAPALATSFVRPLIVLVPGFFNSAIPSENTRQAVLFDHPYFSKAITETVAKRGLEPVVVDNLLPVGSVSVNGERLLRFLDDLNQRNPGREMVIISHSAGGLYTLYALTHRPSLPIHTVVSVATPYNGVEFVGRLSKDVPGLDALVGALDLDSLREFEPSRMPAVLAGLTVPPGVRWVAIAGYQPTCHVVDCTNPMKLSWLLSIAQTLMSEKSDGVITVSSALGRGMTLQSQDGGCLDLERWEDFVIPLEHWEIVQESFLFHGLGVINTQKIQNLQVETFSRILDRLQLHFD